MGNQWPQATIGRHSLSHARWACQLPQRGSLDGALPAPSLRELSSEARLRECTPMNVTAQKFQSLSWLVCKSLAWSNHRTTLPQSRPFGRASSLREGAGNGCPPFNRVLAKPWGYGRFSSPLRKAFAIQRSAQNISPPKKTSGFHRKNDTGRVREPTYRNRPRAALKKSTGGVDCGEIFCGEPGNSQRAKNGCE